MPLHLWAVGLFIFIWEVPCVSKNVAVWQVGTYIHTALPWQVHADIDSDDIYSHRVRTAAP